MITEFIVVRYSPTLSGKLGLAVEKPKKSFCHEYATIIKFVLDFIVNNNDKGYGSSLLTTVICQTRVSCRKTKKSFFVMNTLQFSNLYLIL